MRDDDVHASKVRPLLPGPFVGGAAVERLRATDVGGEAPRPPVAEKLQDEEHGGEDSSADEAFAEENGLEPGGERDRGEGDEPEARREEPVEDARERFCEVGGRGRLRRVAERATASECARNGATVAPVDLGQRAAQLEKVRGEPD